MQRITIQKQLAGNVLILDFSSGTAIKDLQEDAALFFSERRGGGVYVCDKIGNYLDLAIFDVVETEVLPAAPVTFSGDARDLYELLETQFFYNIVNPPAGGGGLVESNIIAKGVNYTLLTTDYIVYATADITLTLPGSPALGQIYKIFAAGNTVTVAANVGQVIIDKTSVSLKKQDAIIVQYIKTNFWGII